MSFVRKCYGATILMVVALLLPIAGKAQTLLHSFNTGYENLVGSPSGITLNNQFYFQAEASDGSNQIWKTDGTAANTSVMVTFPSAVTVYSPFYTFNNQFYFLAEVPSSIGKELWRSDGTPGGTSSLKDIRAGVPSSFESITFSPRVVNGSMLFAADDGINGRELWKTDGTPTGTVLLKDINPGSTGSSLILDADNSIQIGNIVYFTAVDATARSLYRTDGTTAGTYRLVTGFTSGLANVNGMLYFIKNSTPSQGLWKSDGTVEGTQFITNTGLNYASNVSGGISVVSNNLFFYFGKSASTINNNVALFKSDGTAGGTQLVRDNIAGPNDVAPLSGKLFFQTAGTTTSSSGFSLWHSDGTSNGTEIYQEHNMTNGENSPFQSYFLNNHFIYVWRNPGISGNGLSTWITDGTSAGTYALKDQPSPFWVNSAYFVNNKYYMLVNGEIWSSNGTAASTTQISQFNTLFGETHLATDFVPFNSMLLIKNNLKELFSLSTCTLNFTLSASTSATVCPGTSVTLSTSNCTGTLSWNTGATGSSLVVTPSTTTTYTATCTDNGCSSAKPITVLVVASSSALTGTAATGTYKSTQTITSTQTIPSGTVVGYQSGASVTLQPNFQTQTGSLFQTEIKACN